MNSMQTIRVRLATGLELIANRWALWIAAAVVGGAIGALCYEIFRAVTPTYPEFIVGQLAISGANKARDYAMFLGLALGAAGFFVALALLFRQLADSVDLSAVDEAHQRFIVAVIPALAWVGTFLLPSGEHRDLFWAATFLVGLATAGVAVVVRKSNMWRDASAPYSTGAILDGVMLAPIGAMLAVFAIGMIGNRFVVSFGEPWFKDRDAFYGAVWICGSAAIVATVAIALWAKTTEQAVGGFRRLLFVAQIFFPALFLAILPLPVMQDGRVFFADPIRPATWIVLGLLTAATWADLVRLWRSSNRSVANSISMFSLIAVLVYLRIQNLGYLNSLEDDYHAGEYMVAWWSWFEHNQLPYWDFTPVRGLVNYFFGLFAYIFTDDRTASAVLQTVPYQGLAIILLVFPALTAIIGKWRALLVLSFVSLDENVAEIDLLTTAGVCVLTYAWNRCSSVAWLVLWFLIGTVEVLLAPGQGGMLVLATIPVGAWQFYRAVRDERARLLRSTAITLAIVVIVLVATPIGHLVFGAIRYGAEQSAANSVANGVAWAINFGSRSGVDPWLFEILRFGWLGAGSIAAVATVWLLAAPRSESHERALLFGIVVSVLCGLWIARSGGRIDGGISRAGWTTIWVVATMLPVFFALLLRGTRQITALALTIAAASALSTQFWAVGFKAGWDRPFSGTYPSSAQINGADIGVPKLGTALITPTHADRLATIKATLDPLLMSDETYLDMTNRNSHYFYFDRPPPGGITAFYNMITSGQQLRVVSALQKQRVPVALVGADNILPDGLTASTRSPLIYRYLLLNFTPVTLNGYDFMLRPDRFAVGGENIAKPDGAETLRILDRNFLAGDLGRIPSSWGKSADTLEKHMRVIKPLDAPASSLHDVEHVEANVYRVRGVSPSITFDLQQMDLRGRDAGLLQFEFSCEGSRTRPVLGIAWSEEGGAFDPSAALKISGVKGIAIVPLDSAPRWLLSKRISNLRLTLPEASGCATFTLKNVLLAQRKDVDALDTLLRSDPS